MKGKLKNFKSGRVVLVESKRVNGLDVWVDKDGTGYGPVYLGAPMGWLLLATFLDDQSNKEVHRC